MTRILIVEDDEHLSRAMTRVLRPHYDLIAAASLPAALALLNPRLDVILTDWQLAFDDGLDLLEAAHTRCPHARRILMSATALDASARERLHACGAALLRKPFTLEVLEATLDRHLGADFNPPSVDRNSS